MQKQAWNAWKAANPKKTELFDYFRWALANQYYKGGEKFIFNGPNSGCGTATPGSTLGCGFTVTVCGKCVHTSTLGNIMFGAVGAYGGFSQSDLNEATTVKRLILATVDHFDEEAYKLGIDFNAKLGGSTTAEAVCAAFNQAVTLNPNGLRLGNKTGGYNDLGACAPCSIKTTETKHGGNSPPARVYYY